ncbi:MAG: TerB N-terminal domain-containing protein [Desulfovibrio sp.]|nr:TerB N-terminal domain-containing protein [Desulfovibrio sp.]
MGWNDYYTSEAIPPDRRRRQKKLPPALARAVKLEKNFYRSNTELFYKQGMLLADYEDDVEYSGEPESCFNAYSGLSDTQLRGYFSWRTKFRKGETPRAYPIFIFIYINELVNNIGVSSPESGYKLLKRVCEEYSHLLSDFNKRAETFKLDYIAYYDLPMDPGFKPELLTIEKSAAILDNIENECEEAVISALTNLIPKWLGRSAFYKDNAAVMDTLIYRVLKRVSARCAKTNKNRFVDQYLGKSELRFHYLFHGALFANPLKRKNFQRRFDERVEYAQIHGVWYRSIRDIKPKKTRKLDKLIKTIDSVAREVFSFRSKIAPDMRVKWISQIISEEAQNLKKEKADPPKKKLKIDFSSLGKIREDAAETRDKLIVEEERCEEEPAPLAKEQEENSEISLSSTEIRFLRCLLCGKSTAWIRDEGLILSVLVDGINEKLYDRFEDSVLDDAPSIYQDYIDDLKELIPE